MKALVQQLFGRNFRGVFSGSTGQFRNSLQAVKVAEKTLSCLLIGARKVKLAVVVQTDFQTSGHGLPVRIQNPDQTIIHEIALRGLSVFSAVLDGHIIGQTVIRQQLSVCIKDIAACRWNGHRLLGLLQIVLLVRLSVDYLQLIQAKDHDCEQPHIAEAQYKESRRFYLSAQFCKAFAQ